MISSEKQRDKMLTMSIPRLVMQMSIPTVIIQLITLLYNTADTYFISQINKSASAAVGAVFAIMALIQAVGFGFGMGASSICSRLLGKRENEEADRISSSAFFGAVMVGVLIEVLGLLFLEPLLRVIGCSDTMMVYAKPYAVYILLAAPVFCAVFVLNNTLRAEGQTRLAMLGTMGGGLLNIALDPLFIFVFDMGTAGAALATIASQIVSFAILLSQFLMKNTIQHIRMRHASKKLSTYTLILTTGLPTILRQGLASVATAAFCSRAVLYGDSVVAAINIANKCYMLVRYVILGIGQGCQPVIGYNYGAGDYRRTKETVLFAGSIGTGFCCVAAVLLALFASPIMWWFCPDTEVLAYGTVTIRYLCAVLPFLAISTYTNQIYQCLGFRAQATFLASCRQGVFYMPIVMIAPLFLGVTGVEIAQAGADLLTFIVSVPFLVLLFRRHLPLENRVKRKNIPIADP